MIKHIRNILLVLICLLMAGEASARQFTIRHGQRISLSMPDGVKPVARTAAEMLAGDFSTVLNVEMGVRPSAKDADVVTSDDANIVCSIDSTLPREGFRMLVQNGALSVIGADSHGLAYGLLEVSRMLGVSPWEYWADCTPRCMDEFTLPDYFVTEQHPAVAYRGIFINDEDWGLNPWATRQEPEAWTLKNGHIKGAIGPKVNERIFQLMLRLRANYYWPAMHECSQPFFTIEGNREVAAKYGIYIGGSHCEPMATSPAAEWSVRGEGDYNYVTNSDAVKRFWRDRVEAVKDQEIVYTIGMRGVHDGSMQGVKTKEDKLKYLQMVIDDQRQMLQDIIGTDASKVPQVFVPYKEVLEIYKSGLKVPDDVTLMWTDDNYGYIRHFPDSVERSRKGGNGVYYHVSYWGRPHDYLWLNSLSPRLLQQQMLEAYRRGIRQMWVLNVGDIKPSELQIEQFMQLAWDGRGLPQYGVDYFMAREFGEDLGAEIADVLSEYFLLTEEMKPEHMAGTRVEEADKAHWNSIHPLLGDWTKKKIAERVGAYQEISDRVEALYTQMPSDRRDAFFQLVKYPVQAAAQMNFKFLCPERCLEAFDSIQTLTYIYNKVCANGKWDGIMDAAPRKLPVFARVTPDQLFTDYPETSDWQPLNREDNSRNGNSPWCFDTEERTDSVVLRFELFPGHPVVGDKLSFCVEVDGVESAEVQFQTYDRSEEWKQNVLRGYALRTVTMPLDKSLKRHKVRFIPITEGVFLQNVPHFLHK